MTAMKQMTLPFNEFDTDAVNDNQPPLNRHEASFRQFHADNPNVYQLLKRFAKEAIKAGYRHYSMYALFERVRWHMMIDTNGDSFKVNNNHRPYYARMFHRDHPEFDGFFHTRTVNGE